jgi:hypothetical protein
MKNALLLLLLTSLLAISPCFAKRKPKLIYDHIGKLTYHAGHVKYIPEGRTDVYEVGEYTCLGGDEHHAPDCNKDENWYVWDKEPSYEVSLDDGRIITLGWLSGSVCDLPATTSNLCLLISPFPQKASLVGLSLSRVPDDGAVAEFRYGLIDGGVVVEVHDLMNLKFISPKPAPRQ